MAQSTFTITLSLRWWLRYYLYGVVLMCWLTGCEPRADRLGYWIARGTKVKINASQARNP